MNFKYMSCEGSEAGSDGVNWHEEFIHVLLSKARKIMCDMKNSFSLFPPTQNSMKYSQK